MVTTAKKPAAQPPNSGERKPAPDPKFNKTLCAFLAHVAETNGYKK